MLLFSFGDNCVGMGFEEKSGDFSTSKVSSLRVRPLSGRCTNRKFTVGLKTMQDLIMLPHSSCKNPVIRSVSRKSHVIAINELRRLASFDFIKQATSGSINISMDFS